MPILNQEEKSLWSCDTVRPSPLVPAPEAVEIDVKKDTAASKDACKVFENVTAVSNVRQSAKSFPSAISSPIHVHVCTQTYATAFKSVACECTILHNDTHNSTATDAEIQVEFAQSNSLVTCEQAIQTDALSLSDPPTTISTEVQVNIDSNSVVTCEQETQTDTPPLSNSLPLNTTASSSFNSDRARAAPTNSSMEEDLKMQVSHLREELEEMQSTLVWQSLMLRIIKENHMPNT